MKPKPWSHTLLDSFKNCPRAFHAKYVLKSLHEERSPEQIKGEEVHKHFEDRLGDGVVLPPDLAEHEPFMSQLDNMPGDHFAEMKVGFDRQLKPCHFFATDVWWRGVIDYLKVDNERGHALIVDHKTGKPHEKFEQLSLFALHGFAMFPKVNAVRAMYYWTQTKKKTETIFHRESTAQLWSKFVPDLKQYAAAFKTDTWQPRQSGLCKKHCAVLDCEFNGRRK